LIKIREKTKIKHLFVMIHIILLKVSYYLRVMIDCKAIWNFFFQSKLIKINILILNEKFSNSKLKTLDDNSLMIYFDHVLLIEIININESERTSKKTFVEIDMYEMNMILSLFWLSHANFLIWFRERTIVHEKIIHLIASEVRNDSIEKRLEIAVIIEKNLLFNNLVVAIIKMQDILDICESKDVNVYFLDLRFLIMFDLSFIIDVAFANESNEISSEYLEFSDVFFENEIRQLSKHESHDHAIKTKENSSISDLIYNLSLIELKILKSYIENNLIKDFIIFNVFFLSVLILFIKKKDDELRLCVDYKSLNVVIIKNKYLLSLIQKLFDILQKTIRFIKINIRDVFNILRIRVDDK
jgi:hypothetical protein